jgi:DNA polymerase III subunit alpha
VEEQESKGKSCKACVAGIVTDVKTITTKSGSPGAKVIMEDFDGNHEFALFGKEYQEFLPFMQPHAQIFIEGEVTERYFIKKEERAAGKTSPYTFKFKKISLLGNVGNDMISELVLHIDSSQLNQEFRKSLVRLLKDAKGSIPLTINLSDAASGYKIDFRSKKFSVDITQELIDQLGRLCISYNFSRR